MNTKPSGIKVVLDMLSIPPGKRAQQLMRELGIEYAWFETHPIGDCWWFMSVDKSTLPEVLPEYLSVKAFNEKELQEEAEFFSK